MSSERRSVFGIVVVTVCITCGALAAGWFGVRRYLEQQTVNAVHDEAPVAAAPAPRRKAVRAAQADGGRGAPAESVAAKAAPSSAATPAEPPASGATTDEPPGDPERGRLADAESARGRGEPEAPVAPLTTIPTPAAPENHGDARTIMEEAQRRTEAKFYRYDGLLESFDAKDKATEKRWTFDREGAHGQSKAVLRFTAPAEVKGVALLIYNHPERASDQWMWTPSLERDRRIALQDRSTRFFGTDFSFEDLEERDVDQYDYSMLGNEAIDGADCWKIQLTPKRTRSSQYTRSIGWVRKDNYAYARLDHFVKDEIVRRLLYSTIENVQGIWTARQLEMSDLHRGTRTRLTLQQIKYNAPMKDDEFTLQAIRR